MTPKTSILRAGSTRAVKALIISFRLLALAGVMIVTQDSYSQAIGTWTLNNTVAGTGSALSSCSNITAGPAVGSTAFNGGTEWYGQNGFPSGPNINPNAYLQFSVSPVAGYELNIASVVLRMRRSNTGSPAGSGPTQWSLRSSVDGFTNDLASGSMTHNYSNYTIILTGFSQLTTTVTFRLYGYAVTAGSGGQNRLVLDNITVTGSLFALPLKLESPDAKAVDGGNINLVWKAHEISAGTVFSLQRSIDGVDFETIHTITENSEQVSQQYSYTDKLVPSLAATVYYRVLAKQPGGSEQFSQVTSISQKVKSLLQIENAAARGTLLQATIYAPQTGNYTVAIYNADGVLLKKQAMRFEGGAQRLQVTLPALHGGLYVLQVYDHKGRVSRPFIYYQ
jgi:hypothetical protein